jgi:hypothetical protein
MVARISWLLDEMQEAAFRNPYSPANAALVNELMRLGAAITQWTSRFAGDEARAWQRQFNDEVLARFDQIDETGRRSKAQLDEAVRHDRLRQEWEAQVLASSQPDDSAASSTSEESAGNDAAHKYGNHKQQLDKVIAEQRDELSALPSQRARARFLAKKVGCSPSTARDRLKDLGL